MNGVTGRMGLNQHLRRSIGAIMKQGGIRISDAERIVPRPLLVGRNAAKLEAISREFGGLPYTTQLDTALADPEYSIYFDAQTTAQRFDAVSKAIAARQARLLRKAGRRNSGKVAATLPAGGIRGNQARRGAGQALAAGTGEAPTVARHGLLRPHLRRAGRVRLLGF